MMSFFLSVWAITSIIIYATCKWWSSYKLEKWRRADKLRYEQHGERWAKWNAARLQHGYDYANRYFPLTDGRTVLTPKKCSSFFLWKKAG